MKWRNSLTFRFWLALNSFVLIGILTISSFYYWKESANLENSLKNQGITAAKTLNSAIGLYMLKGNYSNVTPLAYSLLSQPNIAYVKVQDHGGATVVQKGEITIDKNDVYIEKVPLEYFQENVGKIEIGIKTITLQGQKKELLNSTVIISLIVSLLSLLLSYLISRTLISPIKKLIAATTKMTAGDRDVEVIENGITEIQQLSASFNKMAQTIHNHEQTLVSEIEKATKDLSEKVSTLEALAGISSSVLEDDVERDEVLKNTLVSIQTYSHAKQISISLLNSNHQLEIYELDQIGTINPYVLHYSDTSLHKAIETKHFIIQNCIEHANSTDYQKFLLDQGIHSILILPIVAKSKVIGTLNIASEFPNYFSKEMVERLSIFTNQIALVMDRVAAYESLQHSAYHDYLTGLPNYRLLKIRIHEEIEKVKNKADSLLAILFLDLDRFKRINDTLGHATGDLLLIRIGKLLLNCLPEDATVARIGGDEFSIILTNITNRAEVVNKAKEIVNSLKQPIIIKGYDITISASIGISFFPNDGCDPDVLIKNADRAMYRVKENGKNNYAIYSSSIDDKSVNQLILESDLRKALEKKEFVVYYQPKINIQTGEIAGMEALIRWQHPDKGFIPPNIFIPQAEETELIIPIGEYVIREAVKQMTAWQAIGLPEISVAVNLSTRQFLHEQLVSSIDKILKEFGLNPNLLELEITESMTMDLNNSLEILKKLKNLGVRISIDDFGTGYSSLNYLRRLPVDRIKIDQSFIKDMTLNTNNQTLVSIMINMAHKLNLVVTAEGVETKQQAEFLQDYHCDEIQGFYFSKPIPAEDFENNYLELLKEAEKWYVLMA